MPTPYPGSGPRDNCGQRHVGRLDLKVDRRPQWRFEGYLEGREVKARNGAKHAIVALVTNAPARLDAIDLPRLGPRETRHETRLTSARRKVGKLSGSG